MITRIYTLHQADGAIRYVGKTVKILSRRLGQHIYDTKVFPYKINHRCNWIRKCLAEGFVPMIKLIEEVEGDDWAARESFWIKHYRDLGCNLVNETEGGEGCPGRKRGPVSEEIRQRLSLSHKGIKHSDVTKARMSAAHKGRSKSMETRMKMSIASKIREAKRKHG